MWAIGLFEGEGCIVFQRKSFVRLTLGMTDQDVVERFRNALGVGNITSTVAGRTKRVYVWNLGNSPDVRRVLQMFIPALGTRRKQRALTAMVRLEQNKGWSTARRDSFNAARA